MLADCLLNLCMYVIEYRRDIFHWLFAMPLLHFLSDSVQPSSSETPTLEPSSVKDTSWWGTQGLEFQSVRRQAAFTRYSRYSAGAKKDIYISYILNDIMDFTDIRKYIYSDIRLWETSKNFACLKLSLSVWTLSCRYSFKLYTQYQPCIIFFTILARAWLK